MNPFKTYSKLRFLLLIVLLFVAGARGARAEEGDGVRISQWEGGLGASEQGVAVNVGTVLEDGAGKNRLRLTLASGQPALQIGVDGEFLPIELVRKDFDGGRFGGGFTLEVKPLSLEGQVQLSTLQDSRHHHLVADPELLATLDTYFPTGAGDMDIRLKGRAGIVGGVLSDADGTSGLIGLTLGSELQLGLDITARDRLELAVGGGMSAAFHGGVHPTNPEFATRLGYIRVLGEGDELGVHLVYEGAKMDTIPEEGPNRDDGQTRFGGVRVRYSPGN